MISRCTTAATTASMTIFLALVSLPLIAVRGGVTARREAAGDGNSLPLPRPARLKAERSSPGSGSDEEGSGEWPPAEEKVSVERTDAESGTVGQLEASRRTLLFTC